MQGQGVNQEHGQKVYHAVTLSIDRGEVGGDEIISMEEGNDGILTYLRSLLGKEMTSKIRSFFISCKARKYNQLM